METTGLGMNYNKKGNVDSCVLVIRLLVAYGFARCTVTYVTVDTQRKGITGRLVFADSQKEPLISQQWS